MSATATVAFSGGVLYGERQQPNMPHAAPAPVVTPVAVAPAPVPGPDQAAPAPVSLPALPAPGSVENAAPPVIVDIPALGISQGLIELGILPNRELEVPQDYDDIGWWNTGPAPGEPGAALLAGHVDSLDGPAVFYHLSTLQPGEVITLGRADGTTAKFVVQGSQTFSKDAFPDDIVYRTTGKASLHLVTCGGTFDTATGHYNDNVVVFADLMEEPSA